ncbi:hypothetical protein GW17_00033292 [Ensete ventricosum]|nr:hypothetical protein GW17_00033292 [Ensete ventricosum]
MLFRFSHQTQALQNLYEYLLDAETKMGTDGGSKNATAHAEEAGNKVPVAAGAGDTNICGGIVQLYWNSILERCLDGNDQIRQTSLKADCHEAIALQLLLKLKRHLKIVYGLNDARCQEFKVSLREDAIDYSTYTASVKRKRPTPRSSRGGKAAQRKGEDDDDDVDDEDWTGGPRMLDFSGQRSNGMRVTRQRLQV